MKNDFLPTIGLEIHAELDTASKMFCTCKNDPEEKHPNINVCPVCMAHPGTLPVINKRAVEYVIRVGFALGGNINEFTQFDRKNYFYPDLPKGYQISQYKYPIVAGGALLLPTGKQIHITRVHLEEDTGSLVHDEQGNSLVDFNRAGVPLMELVTEPVMGSVEEARTFAEEFQLLLRYLDVSCARMERGEMRVEANVSMSNEARKLGTKVEVKNLNSFRSVERAIEYEIKRQREALASGGSVVQETRGWDEQKQQTVAQRTKEEAHDYRYFPEPDLPPLKMNTVGGIQIEQIKNTLPELPWQKRSRFLSEYGLNKEAVNILVHDTDMAVFFERAFSELQEWMQVSVQEGKKLKKENLEKATLLLKNYLLTDLNGLVKEKMILWNELLLTPENFAELIKMIIRGELSSRGAKDILRIMIEEGGDPSQITENKGFQQTSDTGVIEQAVETVKKENEKAVKEYLAGNEKTLQFLIGETMKAVKAKGASANPQIVRELWEHSRDSL